MKDYEEVIRLYLSSIKYMTELEKTPKDFGTGDVLYASEIHTIVAIGKNSGSNMTELAEFMGITKGGVQKFTKKLLSKDLIYKMYLPDNKKDVVYALTEKGNTAFHMHEVFEQKHFGKIYQLMEGMDERDLQVMKDFLSKLNELLNTGE